METFIMIVMLCHLDYFTGQEVCIPMSPNPPIYYASEKECNDAAIEKRKEMLVVGKENNLIITGTYSTCIKDTTRQGA